MNNICINSIADVHFLDDGPKFIGNPTECALIVEAGKSGENYEELRKNVRIMYVFPFRSEEKMMTTVSRETYGLSIRQGKSGEDHFPVRY